MPHVQTDNPAGVPQPVAPYSHVGAWGDLLFVAGQLALDVDSGKPLAHLSTKEQTQVVMRYLKSALEASGSGLDRVLKTTIYVTSLDDYPDVNEVYGEFFDQHRPARATVEVSALVGGLTVEIEAVAVRDAG